MTPPLIKGYLPVRIILSFAQQEDHDKEVVDDGNNIFSFDSQQEGEQSAMKNKFLLLDETFMYVKEHQQHHQARNNKNNKNNNNNATLFVANAPTVPNIRTKLLLKLLFGRYAEVVRVTVVPNPRTITTSTSTTKTSDHYDEHQLDSLVFDEHHNDDSSSCPTFLHSSVSDDDDDGKFAHVTFESKKEMKKALRELNRIMDGRGGSNQRKRRRRIQTKDDDNDYDILHDVSEQNQQQQHVAGLTLDSLEMQALVDESRRLVLEEEEKEMARARGSLSQHHRKNDVRDDNDLSVKKMTSSKGRTSRGILALAQRYRDTCRLRCSRDALLAECNTIMQQYEKDEERAKKERDAAANGQPDDDGFITVTYKSKTTTTSNNNSSKMHPLVGGPDEDEDDEVGGASRSRKRPVDGGGGGGRGGIGGSRKKSKKTGSKMGGALELTDFYRFQFKETRKRSLQELRERFEEDLVKMKKMKEDKRQQFCKPFSTTS